MMCSACGGNKRRHMQLVCPECWKLLTKTLQRRVYAAWNDGDETEDYSAACDAAFDHIRAKREAAV